MFWEPAQRSTKKTDNASVGRTYTRSSRKTSETEIQLYTIQHMTQKNHIIDCEEELRRGLEGTWDKRSHLDP